MFNSHGYLRLTSIGHARRARCPPGQQINKLIFAGTLGGTCGFLQIGSKQKAHSLRSSDEYSPHPRSFFIHINIVFLMDVTAWSQHVGLRFWEVELSRRRRPGRARARARAAPARLINKRLLGKYYVTSRLGVFFGVCPRRRRRLPAAFGHSSPSNRPLFTHLVKCDSCPVDRKNLHCSQFISFSPLGCFKALLLCSVNNCTLLFIFGGFICFSSSLFPRMCRWEFEV